MTRKETNRMPALSPRHLTLALVLALVRTATAQQSTAPPRVRPEGDTLARIFSGDLSVRLPPAPRWFRDGSSYVVIEPAASGSGSDVVEYETATGRKKDVLITAAQLTPAGGAGPLEIADLDWSRDTQRVLVFTNTRRVWRTNSRGDYWVLDRASGSLKKLGGEAPEASLMYATFNPDATQVAYVHDHDIYVEDLATGAATRLAVGVLSSAQQAAALRSLGAMHPFVDLDRVAVWGWSGGGTNTLNLMFRHPELYKVGMAVAPVPDQCLYDTIYQERYMGLPEDNADGYRRGSAINFANGLKGDLLIVHGSGDDNVHYQGTELLVNRLIELGKPLDFMTYPDRTHAIAEGPGTTVHLYELLKRYLTTHLRAGPR